MFRSENRLTLENLLTPVRKASSTCASLSLMVPYSPRRKSRWARATSGTLSASRMGLVVLVHQHHHPLPGPAVQRAHQVPETSRRGAVAGLYRGVALQVGQLLHHVLVQGDRLLEAAAAEAQPHHRMAHRPVPALVDVQPLEQRLAALEQLLQGVHEQALAEAARARQEVARAFVHQPPYPRGLVDVVAAFLADPAEGLDADGELAFHGCTMDRGRTMPIQSGIEESEATKGGGIAEGRVRLIVTAGSPQAGA